MTISTADPKILSDEQLTEEVKDLLVIANTTALTDEQLSSWTERLDGLKTEAFDNRSNGSLYEEGYARARKALLLV